MSLERVCRYRSLNELAISMAAPMARRTRPPNAFCSVISLPPFLMIYALSGAGKIP